MAKHSDDEKDKAQAAALVTDKDYDLIQLEKIATSDLNKRNENREVVKELISNLSSMKTISPLSIYLSTTLSMREIMDALEALSATGEVILNASSLQETSPIKINPRKWLPSKRETPPVNVIKIGRMDRSQIQQGSVDSVQIKVDLDGQKSNLLTFVQTLKDNGNRLPLDPDDAEELNAEIKTLEAQLSSNKPKGTIISESIKTVRNILEGAAGSALVSGLLQMIQHFH